uniref:Uncharacterized protein n=1 Tax=Anguilla anguilla TaxID=7936 RepID=A0A0E9VV56_ANGAN
MNVKYTCNLALKRHVIKMAAVLGVRFHLAGGDQARLRGGENGPSGLTLPLLATCFHRHPEIVREPGLNLSPSPGYACSFKK